MAILDTICRVDTLKVGDDYCKVQVTEDVTGERETLVLWYNPTAKFGYRRLIKSMQLSLLRDAMLHGLKVRIRHLDTFSSVILLVEVYAPAGS